MSATTIKLEGELLEQIKPFLKKKQSLSAFVRESIKNEIKRKKMRKAAIMYTENMIEEQEEIDEMNEWESSDLSKPMESHEPR